MSVKLLLLVNLIAFGTIEAHRFPKSFQKSGLTSKFFPEIFTSFVRNRRDVGDSESLSSSEEVTDNKSPDVTKALVETAWESNKFESLSRFLEEVSKANANITLIGWQRILDDEGRVKEIRSVQLVIPPKPVELPNNIVQGTLFSDDEDDRYLPHEDINEVREVVGSLVEIGLPASSTLEQYNIKEELEFLGYLDKDELYFNIDNFTVYNKTATETAEEVSNFIASLTPKALGKPSVIVYVNGTLVRSSIRPHILGFVNDHFEASDHILLESPLIIAEISTQFPQKEIAKELALHYNRVFDDYKWRVLVNTENSYVTRDVSVTLTYDNYDLDETSDVEYYVYGVNKTNVAQ